MSDQAHQDKCQAVELELAEVNVLIDALSMSVQIHDDVGRGEQWRTARDKLEEAQRVMVATAALRGGVR